MLTRIEIDGFKTFHDFKLDLHPFTVVVGPNASGKSNLFDAMHLLSALADRDIYSAMQGLRGEPAEFFRQTAAGSSRQITLGAEVFLDSQGTDDFGLDYTVRGQRLRYEVTLGMSDGQDGSQPGIFVRDEHCRALSRDEDRASYLRPRRPTYSRYSKPFIGRDSDRDALLVRQDGPNRHGMPRPLSLRAASQTALSTITTAEFPHLYALRKALRAIRFLEINPAAARGTNDRFEKTTLKPDASNLAAVLNRLRDQTRTDRRPDGVLADITADLSSLIPSVRRVKVQSDDQRQYSFTLHFTDEMSFSARVISDGTLRILALLAILDDPDRKGTLCFEEPENGVHEGRIATLVGLLRDAAVIDAEPGSATFQIILNTHSPTVMETLEDTEIVGADVVSTVDPAAGTRSSRTRMRIVCPHGQPFDPELHLTRAEIGRMLRHPGEAG